MNKSDLVDALADATGMTKADATRAVDAMFAPSGGILADAMEPEIAGMLRAGDGSPAP